MYPHSVYFGLKVVSIQVLWDQSIYRVDTWTLRVRESCLKFYVRTFEPVPLNLSAGAETLKQATKAPQSTLIELIIQY